MVEEIPRADKRVKTRFGNSMAYHQLFILFDISTFYGYLTSSNIIHKEVI